MRTEVLMPVMGLGMEEGTISEWHKSVGDLIQKDEPIVTIEIDKGSVEVPSPAAGVVRELRAQPGQTVPVNVVIAVIDTADD